MNDFWTEISAGIKKYLDVYLARVKANPQLQLQVLTHKKQNRRYH